MLKAYLILWLEYQVEHVKWEWIEMENYIWNIHIILTSLIKE